MCSSDLDLAAGFVALHGEVVGGEDGKAAGHGGQHGEIAPTRPDCRPGPTQQLVRGSNAENANDSSGEGPPPVVLERDAVENTVQKGPLAGTLSDKGVKKAWAYVRKATLSGAGDYNRKCFSHHADRIDLPVAAPHLEMQVRAG